MSDSEASKEVKSDVESANEAEREEQDNDSPASPPDIVSRYGANVTDVVESSETIDADSNLLDDIPTDSEEIDLTHMKIQSLRELGLSRFPSLKAVCFRQNFITSLQGVDDLPADLESLDLYDNRIERMDHRLEHFGSEMVSLDLSFNNIRHIRHIDKLTGLTDLYLCQNDVSRIDNINNLKELTNLELGANRIREIKNLENLEKLQSLWLAKNKIPRLQNLDSLGNLRILSIQSNRLSKIEGLDRLENLEELYISHNFLENIEGLEHNTHLKTLDVSNNKIKELSNLSHLNELEELWASGNQIENFTSVERELKHLPNFHTIYLENNPVQKASGVMYRTKVKLALGPELAQIDATPLPRA